MRILAMFRRISIPFALLLLTILGIFGLAVASCTDGPQRQTLLLLVAGLALVGLPAVFILSARLMRRVGRPLRDLAQAAESLRAGGVGPKVFTEGRDEVGALGQSFNQMSEQLTTRIAALEEDRQQLRTILSGMVEGVVALDMDQRILFANDRAMELLEFSTRTPVGRRLWELVRRRPLLDIVGQALKRPEPCREELRSTDGSSR